MSSKLIFKYGTMGAGKSMLLLAAAHNFQERGIPFLILKSSIDTRNGDNVVHSRSLPDRECISVNETIDLFKFINMVQTERSLKMMHSLRYILVDECQFLTIKQINELSLIVEVLNINVICYGLKSDFQTNMFPASKRLFEISDKFEEIESTCDCGENTMFNVRVDSDGNIVNEGEQIEIGGDDRYISLCRNCYYKRMGIIKSDD